MSEKSTVINKRSMTISSYPERTFNMNYTEKIENSWDINGVFGLLRVGVFSNERAEEFIKLLSDISQDIVFLSEDTLDKDFVRLLWYAPLFIEWQIERITNEDERKKIELFKTTVENYLEEILGGLKYYYCPINKTVNNRLKINKFCYVQNAMERNNNIWTVIEYCKIRLNI